MTRETDVHPLAWVPNALTVARILSIPVLMWGILMLSSKTTQGDHILSHPVIPLGVFILAGITDFLDGYLARKWGVASDFGRMIDPIADKLLVAGCLIALVIVSDGNPVHLIPASAIIFRDILVSGAREHAALSAKVMPPTNLAKWKTAFEMLAIFLLIIWAAAIAWLPVDPMVMRVVDGAGWAGTLCLWLAAILSVYTGALYLRAALAR